MCGIVVYKGKEAALPLLVAGLGRLEYRGYDSAGIAYLSGTDGNETIEVVKVSGRVSRLKKVLDMSKHLSCGIGIGHTRWATHGEPNKRNAHPHLSFGGRLALVHNGIVENYDALKKKLLSLGYAFESDTDTEVLASLIAHKWQDALTLDGAVRLALCEVVGAYAIAVMSAEMSGTLVLSCKGSPLLIGKGIQDDFFIASDATALVAHTRDILYLKDGEIAVIQGKTMWIRSVDNEEVVQQTQRIALSVEEVSKDGYAHFMLKEICTQPSAIVECMRGRLRDHRVYLGGIRGQEQALCQASRLILIGCGTSWHAALLGEYILETLCALPVEVEYASEFRYREAIIKRDDVVIAISQSGETADTLAAAALSKEKGATVLGIVNVVGSSIARLTDGGIYLHAGPEIGVASTKTFTTQVTVLIMLALWIRDKKFGKAEDHLSYRLVEDLMVIPRKIEEGLQEQEHIIRVAEVFKASRNFLYLGRGYNFPVALEGALKLKEISYIHAEGYPAAEIKHGPIALIDEDMPVVFVATRDSSYEKIIANVQEVKARKGKVIVVLSEADATVQSLADYVIKVPACHEIVMPILTILPLQLLAYHIARLRGQDIDKPRNLAKSVTVE